MASSIDLSSIPAALPPPGVIPNLSSTYNEMETVSIATWIICALLLIICVALRCFTRFYIMKKMELADFVPVSACIATLIFLGLCITVLTLGAGKHSWDVSASQAIHMLYITHIALVIYGVVIILAKASIILPLISTFTPNKKTWLYWSYVSLLGVTTALNISAIFAVIFACTPIERIWDPLVPGTCINQDAVFIVSTTWNVFTDFWIVVLPLFSIWHLHLATKYKVGVSVMFLTNIFALCASIARMYFTVKLVNSEDQTFVWAQAGLWSVAELVSTICCACMPVFPRLYRWLRESSSTARSARSDQIEFAHHERKPDRVFSDKSFGSGTEV